MTNPFFNFRTLLIAVIAMMMVHGEVLAQTEQARYQTRQSDCHYTPPPGTRLTGRTTDSGVTVNGYIAERVISQTTRAAGLSGGEIMLCSEYGHVEVSDSDDDQVRLQVRWDAFGEGAAQPVEEAKRTIAATPVQIHMTKHLGRLMVRVWHPHLGFTVPGSQPAWVTIRLQVPASGPYRVTIEAFHGIVTLRRLTLSHANLSGRVGEKLKGINGFIGGTELYDVNVAGDIEISNPMTELAAPITARLRVASNSRITANTGGAINIAVQPHPSLGVRAWAGSQNGAVRVFVYGGVKIDRRTGDVKNQEQVEDPTFESKPVRVEVRATSSHGVVNVASMTNAPLRTSP